MTTGLANGESPPTVAPTPTRAAFTSSGEFPVLDEHAGGLSERFSSRLGSRHPVTVFLLAILAGYAALAASTIGIGLLLTKVLLSVEWVRRADERSVTWLVGRRTPSLLDAAYVGSTIAGGMVIPAVLGLFALACVALRRWRVGAFLLFAVAVESGAYRLTTIFVHRQRPDVDRLETLPVEASFPSGHVAASIALYGGLALLLTSRLRSMEARIVVWLVVLTVPVVVGLSRLLQGMHHPTDAVAGALLGVGALLVALFAARAAGASAGQHAARRAGGDDR